MAAAADARVHLPLDWPAAAPLGAQSALSHKKPSAASQKFGLEPPFLSTQQDEQPALAFNTGLPRSQNPKILQSTAGYILRRHTAAQETPFSAEPLADVAAFHVRALIISRDRSPSNSYTAALDPERNESLLAVP